MKSRKSIELSDRFDKRWMGYAVAASTAGAVLTAASPARADIITTHMDLPFALSAPGCGSSYCPPVVVPVDLTGHGVSNFQLRAGGFYNNSVGELGLQFVGVRGAGAMSGAAPLTKGTPIGPRGAFSRSASMAYAYGVFYHRSRVRIGGPWRGAVRTVGTCTRSGFCSLFGSVSDAYLGLQFYLDGQAHYGWAELSLSTFASSGGDTRLAGEVTAFAYDTVLNQSLDAGQTSSIPEPGTLGLLVLGSLGLGIWRRRTAVTSEK